MADLVSEIISQQAIDQLEFANSQLELAVKNVNNVASAAKGITIDFKGAANIGELNATLAKQEQAIKDLETATKKYEGAVNARERATERAAEKELKAIEKAEAARQKELKQIEISDKQKQQAAEREAKALEKLNNAYEQLKVQYKQAADEAKKLGAQFGVSDARAKAAADSAMKFYTSLLAVEKSVGQAQRQVGQYNQAAFAMSQVLREMPSFANSAATGFMALSNNIPYLAEQIGVLKQKNEELKASGGTAIPIWKTLMSAITSPVGLITIATTAITFLAAKTDIFKSSVDEAAKSVEALSQKLQDIRQEMMDAFDMESANINTLVSVLEDTNNLLNLRIAALKELQKLKPQYFNELSQEQDLKGVAKDKLETLKQQILVEKELEATGKRIKALTEERARLEKEKAVESQKGENISYILGLGQNKASDIGDINLQIQAVTEQIESAQKALAAFRKIALSFPTAPDKTKTPKAKKEKAVKDTTLKSESDLLRAEYELSKQRIEQDAQTQKDISENVEFELNKRLDAYMEYQSALFQLSVLERDYIVKQEQAKQAEIREKLKTAKGEEIENLNDQLIASNLRITAAEEKTAGDLVAINKKGANERLEIISSSNDSFIEAQKDLFIKLSTNEEFLYLNEIEALKTSLENKEMTRREYNKRLTELQKKQHIAFLQAEKEFIEKVLANESLTPENRAKYEEKLKNIIAAMAKGEKAPDLKNKKGRPTDRLAKLFVPEDFPEMEQYLEEFYNRTIDLANRAADAIIEAKNRQFDAENARLDEQSRKIEANYIEQSRLIDATVKDENDRYNQQQKLLAQTQAQEATIEQQKREVAKRQAAAQKTAAAAAIIQNTAVAIAAALKYTVGAAPIIALIAASGAIQLAAALNTPIPAYKEGTDNHRGGKFYAGDGGEKELIVSPNKAPYWSKNVTTMYDEPKGTKVIPKSVIDYAMSNTTANTSSLSAAYEAHSNALFAKVVGDIVGKQFEATGRKLAYVIEANKPTQPKGESMREELSKLRNLQGL